MKKSVTTLNNNTILSWLLLLTALGFISDGSYIYAKAQLAQYLIKDAWAQTLSGKRQVRPWSWADTWPVARLKLPEKDIQLFVLSGTNGASLPFGPGHVTGTVFPGESGASIIAGHRDTHFEFMQQMELGEKIQIQTRQGNIIWYEVTDMDVADSRQQDLQTSPLSESLTLITCYPFNTITTGGPLRYIITAKKV